MLGWKGLPEGSLGSRVPQGRYAPPLTPGPPWGRGGMRWSGAGDPEDKEQRSDSEIRTGSQWGAGEGSAKNQRPLYVFCTDHGALVLGLADVGESHSGLPVCWWTGGQRDTDLGLALSSVHWPQFLYLHNQFPVFLPTRLPAYSLLLPSPPCGGACAKCSLSFGSDHR